MDLAFTPEEQAFREEVRAWLKDNPRQCAELEAKLRELYVPAESRSEESEEPADA